MVGLKVCASATGFLVSPIVLANTIKTLSGPPAAVLLLLHGLASGLCVFERNSRLVLETLRAQVGRV